MTALHDQVEARPVEHDRQGVEMRQQWKKEWLDGGGDGDGHGGGGGTTTTARVIAEHSAQLEARLVGMVEAGSRKIDRFLSLYDGTHQELQLRLRENRAHQVQLQGMLADAVRLGTTTSSTNNSSNSSSNGSSNDSNDSNGSNDSQNLDPNLHPHPHSHSALGGGAAHVKGGMQPQPQLQPQPQPQPQPLGASNRHRQGQGAGQGHQQQHGRSVVNDLAAQMASSDLLQGQEQTDMTGASLLSLSATSTSSTGSTGPSGRVRQEGRRARLRQLYRELSLLETAGAATANT